ncbi:DUF1674 domain-containing protein [Methylomonas paludis]|uniref:DUF1674 domain-containing protein n=1 Tax=Methylomonas paludis TaxID=1173101 RepID=A0A975MQG9_9GAMM|nr:succinate dehydrogenase assembly factor 4 [Methylomonas paludis]QWF72158.1 DUF1674 domain-containing protein [Methylomonas paludis]
MTEPLPSPPIVPVAPVPPLAANQPIAPIPEINGPAGLEPTRYGDWERKGRCLDF